VVALFALLSRFHTIFLVVWGDKPQKTYYIESRVKENKQTKNTRWDGVAEVVTGHSGP
jgi:hypothetical protein